VPIRGSIEAWQWMVLPVLAGDAKGAGGSKRAAPPLTYQSLSANRIIRQREVECERVHV